MITTLDKASHFLYRSLDVLLLRRPELTAYGVLCGFIIRISLKLLKPVIPSHYLNILDSLTPFDFAILGVFLLHFPILIKTYLHPAEFNKNIETAFELIRRAKIEGAPKNQLNKLYQEVCFATLKTLLQDQANEKKVSDDTNVADATDITSLMNPSKASGAGKGLFVTDIHKTIINGEDLDVPTYVRKGLLFKDPKLNPDAPNE